MLEDVLAALAEARGLAGRLLVTTDPAASGSPPATARNAGADGAARRPYRRGHGGGATPRARGARRMLTLPGDIPLVTAAEIGQDRRN